MGFKVNNLFINAIPGNYLGESSVVCQIISHGLPQPLECSVRKLFISYVKYFYEDLRNRTSEVDCGKLGMTGHSFAKDGSITGQEVDQTIGEASFLEDLVDDIV